MKTAVIQELIVGLAQSAARDVLSTMLGIDAMAGEAYLAPQSHDGSGAVMSFIGLSGSHSGTGGLQCSIDSACRLASCFLMSDFPEVNEEVLDVIGELTNMIIGNLKNGLEDQLGPMSLSIPTVIYGKSFVAKSIAQEEWTIVPFVWNEGTLNVAICFTDVNEHSKRPAPERKSLKDLEAAPSDEPLVSVPGRL